MVRNRIWLREPVVKLHICIQPDTVFGSGSLLCFICIQSGPRLDPGASCNVICIRSGIVFWPREPVVMFYLYTVQDRFWLQEPVVAFVYGLGLFLAQGASCNVVYLYTVWDRVLTPGAS